MKITSYYENCMSLMWLEVSLSKLLVCADQGNLKRGEGPLLDGDSILSGLFFSERLHMLAPIHFKY
jgi:hypothetical protein